MTYAYGMKGAPAVGNGLGGLPRREEKVVEKPAVLTDGNKPGYIELHNVTTDKRERGALFHEDGGVTSVRSQFDFCGMTPGAFGMTHIEAPYIQYEADVYQYINGLHAHKDNGHNFVRLHKIQDTQHSVLAINPDNKAVMFKFSTNSDITDASYFDGYYYVMTAYISGNVTYVAKVSAQDFSIAWKKSIGTVMQAIHITKEGALYFVTRGAIMLYDLSLSHIKSAAIPFIYDYSSTRIVPVKITSNNKHIAIASREATNATTNRNVVNFIDLDLTSNWYEIVSQYSNQSGYGEFDITSAEDCFFFGQTLNSGSFYLYRITENAIEEVAYDGSVGYPLAGIGMSSGMLRILLGNYYITYDPNDIKSISAVGISKRSSITAKSLSAASSVTAPSAAVDSTLTFNSYPMAEDKVLI